MTTILETSAPQDAVTRLPVVIARQPATRKSRRIRQILADELSRHPYLAVQFAADAGADEIRPLLDRAFLALFDVTRSRGFETLLDLGYALGRHRYCVLLRGPRSAESAGFAGDDRLEYHTLGELRRRLETSVVRWVGRAVRSYTESGRVFANMDARLLGPLGASLLEGDLDDEFTAASRYGFSEEQAAGTLGVLEDLGMARSNDSGWKLSPFGRVWLPVLVEELEQRPPEL